MGRLDHSERQALIRRSFLFKDVPQPILERLATLSVTKHLVRRETLFNRGDEGGVRAARRGDVVNRRRELHIDIERVVEGVELARGWGCAHDQFTARDTAVSRIRSSRSADVGLPPR